MNFEPRYSGLAAVLALVLLSGCSAGNGDFGRARDSLRRDDMHAWMGEGAAPPPSATSWRPQLTDDLGQQPSAAQIASGGADAPEGERRRKEAEHLEIGRVSVPTDNLNRVGRRLRVVETVVQTIQGRLEQRRGGGRRLRHSV